MDHSPLSPEVILWTDPQRAALAGRILGAMDEAVSLIGLGGPRGGDTIHLAQAHDLSPTNDLRQLLVDHPAQYLLLATTQTVDPKLLQLAMSQGTTILSLEPVTSGFEQIIAAKAPQGEGKLLAIPAFTFSPAWTKAGDTQDLLGPIRLIAFESLGPSLEQSLHARLAEAWQVVGRFAGSPESIDCALVGPLTEIPEDPRAITGHLTAHARLPRACSAQITLCDQTSNHHRRLMVIGDQGRLMMTDYTYHLHGPDGQLLERADLLPPASANITADPFGALAVAQWRRLISHPDHPWPIGSTQDQAANLGSQLASLLSARTSQPENPGRMAQLARM